MGDVYLGADGVVKDRLIISVQGDLCVEMERDPDHEGAWKISFVKRDRFPTVAFIAKKQESLGAEEMDEILAGRIAL